MHGPTRKSQELLEEISRLKQTIAEMKREQKKDRAQKAGEALLTYLENAPDGAYMIDARGTFLYGNKKSEEVIGYTRDELVGKNLLEINMLTEKSRGKVRELLQFKRKGKPTGPDELEMVNKEGRTVPIEFRTDVVEYMGKKVVLGFVRDITERIEAREEIAREKERLKALSDSAPFGLVVIDREGRFTYVNARFTDLFGYDLNDTPDGRTWFRKAYPDPQNRRRAIRAWIEDMGGAETDERRPRVFTATCKNGVEKIVEMICSALATGGYLLTCEDITELKSLESQLRQSQKMEAVGTLAGGIAHDFNNILTSLTGYANLMQMKMDTANPLRPYLEQVLSAARKAADLTNSLLAFSRQGPVNLAPLDINSTIETTRKLLKRLLTEDIELRTALMKDDAIVMADRSQIDQILFNLVTNARDAMPQGGTLILETAIVIMDARFVKVHGFGEIGRYARISISDTGEGMDEAIREKIFNPFFTTKEVGKGTGLGLATVYGIVKQHHGYITVYSEPGHGTTFRIYLPVVHMKVNEEPDANTVIKRGNETVLIAEDDEAVRRFMREALEEYGYRTIEAIDGEDAIGQYIQNRNIDLVIVDSVMPRKNGWVVCEEIRKMNPHIKTLFTSGYTKDIVLGKGIEDYELNFIAKPLSCDDFLRKVREVLDR